MKISQSFNVSQPLASVWELFQDGPRVARCMPGAELTEDAKRFLMAYRRFEESVRSYADEAFVEIMGG